MPRRRALRIFAGAFVAAMLPAALRPERAGAVTCNGTDFKCQCPSINGLYYEICCPEGDGCKCYPPPGGGAQCVANDCPKPKKRCHALCCEPGEICCGGGTCCKPGEACCNGICCPRGQRCHKGKCGKCPKPTKACGHDCCEKSETCCGGHCCNNRTQKCCSHDHCCAKDDTCCGVKCCTDKQTCCGDHCCTHPKVCCGDGCCPANHTCIGDSQCCPDARVLHAGGGTFCCPSGSVASGAKCCPTSGSCTPCDPACPSGQFCNDGYCLPA